MGGMVYNVALVLRDVFWFLDNSMTRFVELAGGPNCFPAFIPSIGQPSGYDGINSRKLWDDFVQKKRRCNVLTSKALEELHEKSLSALLMC